MKTPNVTNPQNVTLAESPLLAGVFGPVSVCPPEGGSPLADAEWDRLMDELD